MNTWDCNRYLSIWCIVVSISCQFGYQLMNWRWITELISVNITKWSLLFPRHEKCRFTLFKVGACINTPNQRPWVVWIRWLSIIFLQLLCYWISKYREWWHLWGCSIWKVLDWNLGGQMNFLILILNFRYKISGFKIGTANAPIFFAKGAYSVTKIPLSNAVKKSRQVAQHPPKLF